MNWRMEPPVFSPVSPRALAVGLAASAGLAAPDVKGVEHELCSRYGAIEALLTDSGTAALVLALRAFVPKGGTVALPAYGCVDLTAAAQRAEVKVRLYDLDPLTMSPDLDSVRAVIERGIRAIVVTHLFGYAASVTRVQELAAPHGVRVIEDAAQCAGGTLWGTRLGGFGDLAVLSFNRGKGVTAGSGGAVLVRSTALREWAHGARAELRLSSRGGREVVDLAAQWLFAHAMLYRIPASLPFLHLGEMVYHPAGEPRGMTLEAVAILAAALRLEDAEVECRRKRAHELLARIPPGSPLRAVEPIAGAVPGYLRLALLDRRGIVMPDPVIGAVRGYPQTLAEHAPMKDMLLAREDAGAGACQLRDHLFTLPTHSRAGKRDNARIDRWLSGLPTHGHAHPMERA